MTPDRTEETQAARGHCYIGERRPRGAVFFMPDWEKTAAFETEKIVNPARMRYNAYRKPTYFVGKTK